VKVRGKKILLCNTDGTYHAIGAACPHLGLPLHKGDFDGQRITCRYHGAQVDVTTGRLVTQPGSPDWSRSSMFRRISGFLGKMKKPARDACGVFRVEVRGKYVFVAVDADRQDAPASVQQNDREPAATGC
jgi:nitrite reductase/ring-hydroxylating ferredoxin subunit